MVTNWKKIFVKCLVNYWKITGKRLETEQNGLINFDHSGAYFYPGDLETLSERKFCLFLVRNDISPGFSLTTAAGVHRQQKEQTAGTHGGTLWAVCSASGVSIALFALYCKKLNFLRDICDFDSYISYRGFLHLFNFPFIVLKLCLFSLLFLSYLFNLPPLCGCQYLLQVCRPAFCSLASVICFFIVCPSIFKLLL